MSVIPPNNVKIYDRPERTGPSPVLWVVVLVIVVIVGYFLYRTFYHPATPQPHARIPSTWIRASARNGRVNVCPSAKHGRFAVCSPG